jgi:hypothetical protein
VYIAICATIAFAPVAAEAQSENQGRVEIASGVSWIGPATFDRIDATETTPSGGQRVVFSTRGALESSTGLTVRIGARLTSWIGVESALALNLTRLSTRISADVEQAAPVTAAEGVTQYLVEGGVVARLRRWRVGRWEPFAAAGAGYLRHLNEGKTLVQTGRSYYAGGGGHYALRRSDTGRIKSAGLRVDLRATILKDGVALDRTSHLVPTAGAGVFMLF